jgi:hypothetical protein
LGQAQLLARSLGLLRVGGKCAGHEFIVIVHPRGEPVHGADESPLTAAHHAKPDAARIAGFRSFP